MSRLVGACLFGQSGGPTSVINASAAGVFTEALSHDCITNVYGAVHGIKGILDEDFIDISKEDPCELELLKSTPSSALGSVRYKLADPKKDDKDYKRILEVFRKYNIRYFFYNGGNDSMDTCSKISTFVQNAGYECRVMGVPKTIDNDLSITDHCPGYGSAAKYIATTCMELYHDARVYNTPMACIIEIMGRNAGWLTAASALASYKGAGPDLIYLPEVPFTIEKFRKDIKKAFDKNNGKVIAAVSEGVKDKDGRYVVEMVKDNLARDSFGHAQLGGTASVLAEVAQDELKCKVRGIEFSLMQRCASHLGSKSDVDESFMAGQTAVIKAIEGYTDYMVGFERAPGKKYVCTTKLIRLADVANAEKTVPLEWIINDGTFVSNDFIDYALPLIQGTPCLPLEDGLPRFAKLKKVRVKKL
jgi:ATP-dependent phosphofructokinase / diphosphate-dependent phosphofructokinase